ncbi:chymotrypsin-elastase inhibitor ixodidin-like [Trichogramma pretiosum]|uniref:TIL domain-containing protein n=1 Tax=Trichogramma kaykai TaxID=54128 RepID=A0ABD2XJC8_9HYME|nr:chymotrypsin-elastase inhibitor ixodidin-like [Trichogramma pretiosum]
MKNVALCLLLVAAVCACYAQAADPIRCPAGSHYSRCGTICPRTCRNPTGPTCQAISCPDKPTCYCNNGYVKNNQGRCVRPSQCPR